jgi:hypothetical protein
MRHAVTELNDGRAQMKAEKTFRVAVLGTPQTEQWLLTRAFAATRERRFAYEQIGDPAAQRPDMFVVDAEDDHAMARWAALDSKGTVPAAFFSRVHPRAKSGVIVPRPLTSASVVDALDQLTRRFMEVAEAPRRELPRANAGLALAAA